MVQFFFENIDEITIDPKIKSWIEEIILTEHKRLGEIDYIFCDDDYLLQVNRDFLKHDYYTDIITFDYVKGKTVSADIFVSLPRISENAITLKKDFQTELNRVLAHGVLHLCGYKDKSEQEIKIMRQKEDFYLDLI
jgi:probable rRNA maturation factor